MSKIEALAKHLDISPALIENGYSHYYTINERTVKVGRTPEEMQKVVDDFRSLLDTGMQGLITATLESDRTREETQEVYDQVKDSLKPLHEKAMKLKQRRESNPNEIGEKSELWRDAATYLRLDQEHLYVVNIAYRLLLEDADYSVKTRNEWKNAWLGKPVNDIREDSIINDGEYLVLTDEEADEWEREGLEQLFDEMTHGVPEHLKRFMDSDAYVEEYSGNRGENINGYDGTEESITFDGVEYFIYRNN